MTEILASPLTDNQIVGYSYDRQGGSPGEHQDREPQRCWIKYMLCDAVKMQWIWSIIDHRLSMMLSRVCHQPPDYFTLRYYRVRQWSCFRQYSTQIYVIVILSLIRFARKILSLISVSDIQMKDVRSMLPSLRRRWLKIIFRMFSSSSTRNENTGWFVESWARHIRWFTQRWILIPFLRWC